MSETSPLDSVTVAVASLSVNSASATPVANDKVEGGEENEGLTLRSLVSTKEAGKHLYLISIWLHLPLYQCYTVIFTEGISTVPRLTTDLDLVKKN